MLMCGITSSLWLLLLLHVPGLQSMKWNLFKHVLDGGPQEGVVRLVGGQLASEGRVEVYHDGKWGTVCDDDWDLTEAQVVCRQLQFPGAKSAIKGGTYGDGSGPIWLDDMDCKGTEKSLSSCSFKGWAITDCSHKEDAGVVCERVGTDVSSDAVHSLDHSLGLSEELGELFGSGESCDFNILVRSSTGNKNEDGQLEMEESTICTHRLVLTLFPLFNVSSSSSSLTIEVNQSCRSYVTNFIRYLYTRKVDVTISSAQCLHQLASEFGVRQLMQDTGKLFTVLLPEDGTFHTQVSMYQYAVYTADLVLQENCLQYLAWNCEALTSSPAWSDLSLDTLMALLSRSDLVVPDEAFLLQALESLITERGNISLESQAALLGHIRFPMIPAEKLYELQFTSKLYSSHEKLYRISMLRGFQFNALPFATLKKHTGSEGEGYDYQPRIYTTEPWSFTINLTNIAPLPSYPTYYRDTYNYRQRQYGYYQNSRRIQSFSTPVHNTVVFQTNMISWSANVFLNQQDCVYSGFSCDSTPVARLYPQTSLVQYQNASIRFSNRLLLTCEGKYIFHIQDFKDNLAQIPTTNNSQAMAYPCPGSQSYLFVIRPEYI